MSDALVSTLNTAISKGSDRVGSIEFWRKFLSYVQENVDKITANLAPDQYSALTQVTPASTDRILVEDASDGFKKKYVEAGALGGGATTFLGLTDTPSAFTGQALKVARVNAGETALEFATLAGGGDLLAANNLSDLSDAGTARTNLGLGSIATQSADALQGTFDFERFKTWQETSGFSMAISSGGDDYTADRVLEIITGDASRSLTLSSNATVGGDLVAIASEVATARGSRSALNDRISVISNFASPNAGGIVVGNYYDNAFQGTASSTVAGAANRIDLAPFYTSTTLSIDQIGIAVSTAVASAQCKVVIYSSTADGWPDVLLYESAALDAGTTGYKSASLTFTFNSGTQYWVGVRHSSTATIRTINVSSAVNLGVNGSNGANYFTILRRTLAFATAATSPWNFTSSDLVANVTPPSIRFRAA